MTSTMKPQEWGGANRYRRDSPPASSAFGAISGGAPLLADNTSATSTFARPKVWTLTAPTAGSSNAGGVARVWGLNRFYNKSTYGNAIAPDPTVVSPGGNWYFTYEIDTDAPALEFDYYSVSPGPMNFRMWVDEQLVNANQFALTNSGGAMHKLLVSFTSGLVKVRRIRLQVENIYLASVTTTIADTVWAPPSGKVRVCFLTDSYGQYQGYDAFQFTTGRLLGWEHVDMNTVGGTGYNNMGGSTDYTFQARAADVISGGYDIVVICGGLNDVTTNLQTQAATLFSTLQAGLPNAKIIAVGPWNPSTASNAATKMTAISAAATAAGITSIDPTAWYTGTGHAQLGPVTPVSAVNAAAGTLTTATYCYQVTAIDGIGETAASAELSVAVSSGSATVTWTAVAGATGYRIYRGTTAGGENLLAGTTSGNSTVTFTDTGASVTSSTPPSVDTTGFKYDGNQDRFIVAAGTHPTLDGAKYLGSRLANAIHSTLAA